MSQPLYCAAEAARWMWNHLLKGKGRWTKNYYAVNSFLRHKADHEMDSASFWLKRSGERFSTTNIKKPLRLAPSCCVVRKWVRTVDGVRVRMHMPRKGARLSPGLSTSSNQISRLHAFRCCLDPGSYVLPALWICRICTAEVHRTNVNLCGG